MDRDDILAKAARDMDAAIAADQTPVTQPASVETALTPESIRKAIVDGVKSVLAKANGAPRSDMTLDAKGRSGGEVISTEDDPAKTPKKAGQGYKDSSAYTAKGDESADDDDDDDDDDSDDDDSDMPAFFQKKGKGKKKPPFVKKSFDEVEDEDAVDATEFIQAVGSTIHKLEKSVSELRKGITTFGELLAEVADPRRDRLAVSNSNGLAYLINEVKEIKKSLATQDGMMKSIAQLPGAPRVAGASFVPQQQQAESSQSEVHTSEPDALGRVLSPDQRNALWKARQENRITESEWKRAKRGDTSIIAKAMA
jgi:hypothetical protein